MGLLVANVVEIKRHVVSWADRQFNGLMGNMFNFRGEHSKETEKVRAEQHCNTADAR